MALTSVVLNTLEIGSGTTYATGLDTLSALEAGIPRRPVLVSIAGDHPAFIRSQMYERTIPIIVYMLENTKDLRRTAFAALEAAAGGGTLVALKWTAEAVTRQYMVHVEEFIPDGWFHRAVAQAVAADPVPETV